MNQRSLVGMTQSARKRAARVDADSVCLLELAATQGIDAYMPAWHQERLQAGGKYRIGERLRPCLGCALCQPCAVCGEPSACVGLYDALHANQKREPACDECCAHGCEDGHCDKRNPEEARCDGSGVLPAKRSAGGGQ